MRILHSTSDSNTITTNTCVCCIVSIIIFTSITLATTKAANKLPYFCARTWNISTFSTGRVTICSWFPSRVKINTWYHKQLVSGGLVEFLLPVGTTGVLCAACGAVCSRFPWLRTVYFPTISQSRSRIYRRSYTKFIVIQARFKHDTDRRVTTLCSLSQSALERGLALGRIYT